MFLYLLGCFALYICMLQMDNPLLFSFLRMYLELKVSLYCIIIVLYDHGLDLTCQI